MSSTEAPAVLQRAVLDVVDHSQAASSVRIETVLAVLFAAAAVLFASYLAVISSLA